VFDSLVAELLERGESGFGNPIASAVVEPRDSQTQMKVRGMQESDHPSALG
jgi:hypothetical protein